MQSKHTSYTHNGYLAIETSRLVGESSHVAWKVLWLAVTTANESEGHSGRGFITGKKTQTTMMPFLFLFCVFAANQHTDYIDCKLLVYNHFIRKTNKPCVSPLVCVSVTKRSFRDLVMCDPLSPNGHVERANNEARHGNIRQTAVKCDCKAIW